PERFLGDVLLVGDLGGRAAEPFAGQRLQVRAVARVQPAQSGLLAGLELSDPGGHRLGRRHGRCPQQGDRRRAAAPTPIVPSRARPQGAPRKIFPANGAFLPLLALYRPDSRLYSQTYSLCDSRKRFNLKAPYTTHVATAFAAFDK